MISILRESHDVHIEKQELLNIEERVIKMLDFSLVSISPIHFLDRYLRIFGIDERKHSKIPKQIVTLTRQYCRFTQREAKFLQFKPSAIAAACFLCAINISLSKTSESVLGLKKMSRENLEESIVEAFSIHSEPGVVYTIDKK